jgi:hypothetical protein
VKLVFSEEEVAAALNISVDRFAERRATLEAEGFPKPLPGLERSWSILEVIDWVNHGRTAPVAEDADKQRQSVVVALKDRLNGGH